MNIFLNGIKVLYKNNFLFAKKKYFGYIKINENVEIKIFNDFIKLIFSEKNFFLKKTLNKKIFNLFLGINNLWETTVFFSGIGYKISIVKNKIFLDLGFSSAKFLIIPTFINIDIKKDKIILKSVYKDKIGIFVYNLLKLKKFNPYKKKGIFLLKNLFLKKSSKKKQ